MKSDKITDYQLLGIPKEVLEIREFLTRLLTSSNGFSMGISSIRVGESCDGFRDIELNIPSTNDTVESITICSRSSFEDLRIRNKFDFGFIFYKHITQSYNKFFLTATGKSVENSRTDPLFNRHDWLYNTMEEKNKSIKRKKMEYIASLYGLEDRLEKLFSLEDMWYMPLMELYWRREEYYEKGYIKFDVLKSIEYYSTIPTWFEVCE